jgi:hypothetical protein
MTPEPLHRNPPDRRLADLATATRAHRHASLQALHVLEYALSAPAPRRHRTWVHRVQIAANALARTLHQQLHPGSDSIDLLAEVALTEPAYELRIQRLRQELLDLSIALASLREQIEPDPEFGIDPNDIRERLAGITRRFRQHRAREADLIYEATGINLDDELDPPQS